ncbi:uncharacterized protein SPSK_08559 [Sporothrix schenckii 1099-18]|uniref:Zn(2)-C6 fungal-type domain-containing protein n=1 Tax=Sporothrix schenckii 1099-18 TaxID=1397361 RepID=A0A0F2MAC5_SPOSC|nr:uncharacterized protein SPSK_08559 [Sporothrix schenckii 1099-18]KJR86024.1 hypothetical protein SPSK_08559 [Sporothrix schenckii 1099-18]
MASVPPAPALPKPTTQNDSAKRRRASRACLACRARKVRCDVIVSGKPCTNCRLDFSECVVQLRRKNRCRTIVVPSDNHWPIEQASDSDNDGVPKHPTPTAQLASSTKPPPTQLADAREHEANAPPPFDWNDPLAAVLLTAEPAATTQSRPSVSEPASTESVSLTAAGSSDSGLRDHGLGGDNDLDELDLFLNMDDGEEQQTTKTEDAVLTLAQPLGEDEPMSYELLSHTVDNFSLYGGGIDGTTHDNSDYGCSSSEAWQQMHFPLSPPLLKTGNANLASMSFASAMGVGSAGLGLDFDMPTDTGALPPRLTKIRTREHTPERTSPPPSAEKAASAPATTGLSTGLSTAVVAQPSTANNGPAFVIFSRYPFLSSKTLWKLDHEDDALLLEQRGCLHVPKKPILDELMKKYFLHVHPLVPLLNENDFWSIYNSPTPQSTPFGQISLFVFQAMLFSVTPFVSQSTLSQLGFSSAPEARANFYRRAKTLFYLEEGRDDVCTAQGALMLTYYAPNMKDRTNCFWMSTAIHFARNANAHRYYDLEVPKNTVKMSTKPNITYQRRTILKRLWWFCVVRDKVMALGMRRPMLIGAADFDMSRPGLNVQDAGDEIDGLSVYSPATKRVFSQVFAALCRLSGVLTGALDLCYPASGTPPRSDRPPAAVAQDYVSKLDAWYEAAAAKFQGALARIGSNVDGQLVLVTNASYIYYYIARASVYNYLSHVLATHPEAAASSISTYGSPPAKVDESFRGVTKSLAELKRRDLVRYLPNTFVSMAILPFKWHVASVRMTGGKLSGNETDLTIYYAVFKGFGELYEMTDSALKSVGTIQT